MRSVRLRLMGRYARVFLRWDTPPKSETDSQGACTERGMGIDDEGQRESGTRYRLWRRSGTTITMLSSDNISDGNQGLCRGTLSLADRNHVSTLVYAEFFEKPFKA